MGVSSKTVRGGLLQLRARLRRADPAQTYSGVEPPLRSELFSSDQMKHLGAALAGFLLGFIEIFTTMVFPSTLRDLIAYSIILLILTFRPYGFFGQAHSTQLRL
jgi:hypothetical protein